MSTPQAIGVSYNGKKYTVYQIPFPHLKKIESRSWRPRANGANKLYQGDCLGVLFFLLRTETKIDFIYIDPPYNTGSDAFPYFDGRLLKPEEVEALQKSGYATAEVKSYLEETRQELSNDPDFLRRLKWAAWMRPILHLARQVLKDTGVIAVSIGYNEQHNLKRILDAEFGEANSMTDGPIVWRTVTSGKNDSSVIPSTIDFVYIYAKDIKKSYFNWLTRTPELDQKYNQNDGSPDGFWRSHGGMGAVFAKGGNHESTIESPITGKCYSCGSGRHWCWSQEDMVKMLSIDKLAFEIKDGNIVVKGDKEKAKEYAKSLLEKDEVGKYIHQLPELFFNKGGPTRKEFLKNLSASGRRPSTWLPEDLSGRNDRSKNLLKRILGHVPKQGEDIVDLCTPKPLELLMTLQTLFCPPDGVVLDFMAGTGMTGYATMLLNNIKPGDLTNKYGRCTAPTGSPKPSRTFILVEIGDFASRLTANLLRRVITGELRNGPKQAQLLRNGKEDGFQFWKIVGSVDPKMIVPKSGQPAISKEIVEDLILSIQDASRIIGGTYVIGKTSSGEAVAYSEKRVTLRVFEDIKKEAEKLINPGCVRHIWVDGIGVVPDPKKVFYRQLPENLKFTVKPLSVED